MHNRLQIWIEFQLKARTVNKMTRGGGRGGTAGGGRNNVGFVKPQEPKFLREIKEKVESGLDFNCCNLYLKVGYREPEGIEAKMRRSEGGEEREDAADEAPTVVVLNKGDLTEEEVIWHHNGYPVIGQQT